MREAGSPFDCEKCTEADKEARNCFNRLGLSEEARAVETYTEEVKTEIKDKKAQKVFGIEGIRFYECPLSYLADQEIQDIARAVYLMEGTGHLYNEGGIGDQPYWLIEAIEIFRTEKVKADKKRVERGGEGNKGSHIGG